MASKIDRSFRVLGFGSPLVDLRAEVSDDFLKENVPGGKGGTLHVTPAELDELVSRLPEAPLTAPGGSAGNTVSALNRLGVGAELLGKAGDDEYGRFFRESFIRSGGTGSCIFSAPGAATGVCLSLTTPDGERTMRSNLGSSLDLNAGELATVDFRAFDLVLVEGYMIDCPVFDAVLEKARTAGCRIAFDPGSFELATEHRECFDRVIRDFADILFINRAEAESLCGKPTPEKLAEELSRNCPCVVLKLGARGALIKRRNEEAVAIPAFPAERVVDTTAAGDMFAAGFLFGLADGRRTRECGELGARLAAEIVGVSGTELPEAVWRKLGCQFATAAE